MVPDRNLARYVAKASGRNLTWWDGFCPTHDRLTVAEVMKEKEAHPDALFIAHPECTPEVFGMADAVLSTSGMLDFCRRSNAKEFIVGTESGLLYRLKKENPEKNFMSLPGR